MPRKTWEQFMEETRQGNEQRALRWAQTHTPRKTWEQFAEETRERTRQIAERNAKMAASLLARASRSRPAPQRRNVGPSRPVQKPTPKSAPVTQQPAPVEGLPPAEQRFMARITNKYQQQPVQQLVPMDVMNRPSINEPTFRNPDHQYTPEEIARYSGSPQSIENAYREAMTGPLENAASERQAQGTAEQKLYGNDPQVLNLINYLRDRKDAQNSVMSSVLAGAASGLTSGMPNQSGPLTGPNERALVPNNPVPSDSGTGPVPLIPAAREGVPFPQMRREPTPLYNFSEVQPVQEAAASPFTNPFLTGSNGEALQPTQAPVATPPVQAALPAPQTPAGALPAPSNNRAIPMSSGQTGSDGTIYIQPRQLSVLSAPQRPIGALPAPVNNRAIPMPSTQAVNGDVIALPARPVVQATAPSAPRVWTLQDRLPSAVPEKKSVEVPAKPKSVVKAKSKPKTVARTDTKTGVKKASDEQIKSLNEQLTAMFNAFKEQDALNNATSNANVEWIDTDEVTRPRRGKGGRRKANPDALDLLEEETKRRGNYRDPLIEAIGELRENGYDVGDW